MTTETEKREKTGKEIAKAFDRKDNTGMSQSEFGANAWMREKNKQVPVTPVSDNERAGATVVAKSVVSDRALPTPTWTNPLIFARAEKANPVTERKVYSDEGAAALTKEILKRFSGSKSEEAKLVAEATSATNLITKRATAHIGVRVVETPILEGSDSAVNEIWKNWNKPTQPVTEGLGDTETFSKKLDEIKKAAKDKYPTSVQ